MKGTERGDCSVVALARGMELPYDVAHAMCKKHGRKDKSGFSLHKVFGFQYYGSRKEKAKQLKGRRVSIHKNKRGTLATFMKKHPTGTYIICVYQHYCTLVDGKMYNHNSMNDRVKYYFRISKKKTPPVETGGENLKLDILLRDRPTNIDIFSPSHNIACGLPSQ